MGSFCIFLFLFQASLYKTLAKLATSPGLAGLPRPKRALASMRLAGTRGLSALTMTSEPWAAGDVGKRTSPTESREILPRTKLLGIQSTQREGVGRGQSPEWWTRIGCEVGGRGSAGEKAGAELQVPLLGPQKAPAIHASFALRAG